MVSPRVRRRSLAATALAAVAVAAGAGCAPQAATEVGGTPLAPRFSAEPGADRTDRAGADRGKRVRRERQPDPATPATTGATAPAPGGGGTRAPGGRAPASKGGPTGTPTRSTDEGAAEPSAGGAPARARVTDPASDVDGAPTGTPTHVDLLGAELGRADRSFTLRVEAAGAFPARQEDSRTQNVVLFVDLDGDGRVDHEMWAALADDGWSTSHRRPDGATYGPDSGVTARATASTLVLRFSADHLEGARDFRWAVGTEWGTLEQVATGTTAQDLAPDSGSVTFPA